MSKIIQKEPHFIPIFKKWRKNCREEASWPRISELECGYGYKGE